ncbi:hypothetical protein MFIFM68171_03356 [Madurella fahalii]|uniref:Uncharacterized protein n=1 Tax=Madurella fahalii TaxID=1157608 RepID=A0ABQ0G5U5_9PEZI
MFASLHGGSSQALLFRPYRHQPVVNFRHTYILILSGLISRSSSYSASSQYRRNATRRAHQQPPSLVVRQGVQSRHQTLRIPYDKQTGTGAPATSALQSLSALTSILSPAASRAFTTSCPQATRRRDAEEDMASDEDYMAFLNKANQDPSEGVPLSTTAKGQEQQGRMALRATQPGVEVPATLARLVAKGDAFYVSDADEPFEAVALGWDETGKGLPDEEEFAGLIQHWDPKNADVGIMDPVDWDPNGQYGEVIDAVREAGQGNDVRVYRLALGGVRAEYWVLTTEGKGKEAKLVGVRALAVES